MRRETELQHHGEDRERHEGAVGSVIYRTSNFAFPDTASFEAWFRGERSRFLYSREANPTVRVLEEKTALLEGTEQAIAFSSGMGAISAVLLASLGAGDHLALFSRSYGPTLVFARDVLPRLGVDVSLLAPSDLDDLERHLRESTRLIYVESPASLTFEVTDLERVAAVARRRGIPTACDNSWASPLYQQPARFGIDLVIHSGTKYIGGHSDLLLGLVAGSARAVDRLRPLASLLGACLSPADAALAVRGLRTLPLRMERHGASALELARRLRDHPRVLEVFHPALETSPSHALWKRQFAGSSGLFSFALDGDARRFSDALELFLLGVSWGGHESLAFPAIVARPEDSSRDVRPDLPEGLIRLSVGLEVTDDLWADLERGFAAVGG